MYPSNAMKLKHPIKKRCEYCGKDFPASNRTVRYCSHACNSKAYRLAQQNKVAALTATLVKPQRQQRTKSNIVDRPYINVAEAAVLIGVCRQTVYNLLQNGRFHAARLSSRLTLISRQSVDDFILSNTPYERRSVKEYKQIDDWYTLDEITAKYGIKRHQIRNIVNSVGISEKKEGTRTLIAKNKLDSYFRKHGFDHSILNLAEWYTAEEIQKQYTMTETAVRILVSRYKIPKMRRDGKKYYSKQHIDRLKTKTL